MRHFLIAATLFGLAAPAVACPPVEACLTHLPSTVTERPATAPRVIEAVRLPRSAPRLAPGEIEMPWIWQALRDRVYARLPRYEQPRELTLVLAPVVVTSPADTVPGVGVSGAF